MTINELMASRMAELREWFDANPDLDAAPWPEAPFVPEGDGCAHVWFQCRARNGDAPNAKERCLTGAAKCLEILAHGLTTYIRVNPEAECHRDFMYDRMEAVGYVRFAVFPEEGKWHEPMNADGITYVSFGQ